MSASLITTQIQKLLDEEIAYTSAVVCDSFGIEPLFGLAIQPLFDEAPSTEARRALTSELLEIMPTREEMLAVDPMRVACWAARDITRGFLPDLAHELFDSFLMAGLTDEIEQVAREIYSEALEELDQEIEAAGPEIDEDELDERWMQQMAYAVVEPAAYSLFCDEEEELEMMMGTVIRALQIYSYTSVDETFSFIRRLGEMVDHELASQ